MANTKPASFEPIAARLEIDTSGAGSSADVLRRRIEERANIVLRHAQVLPGEQDDALLSVVVEELGDEAPGYAATFELRAADGSVIDAPTRLECSLCTETELVARVEAELEPVVVALRAFADAQPVEAPTTAPPPEGSPTHATPPARGHAGMLAGGVTLLVLGTGSVGAAIGLIVPEPKIDQDNPLDLITTRPVGYGLIAGGLACAITGAVLTAIAVNKRREARLLVAPFGDRRSVGVRVGWRFQ
ncbi:hypothetical protein DB30_04876 [Enhygromyxa salina]|uniref:Uncharacterized protein n=1 Tax=Enhygromyxa salina TaxID=215803 RepID=A0A0C1ZY23_9BACT|nr:hypothetical protein [Enhygromyxa salina]KIG16158.1 hypothetical protein DB30_04876 [Enhygromyxa salina]